MKKILYSIIITTLLVSCSGNKPQKSQENTGLLQTSLMTQNVPRVPSSAGTGESNTPIKEIISTYLQLKNALVKDNSPDAATGGTRLKSAFLNFNKSVLKPDQKKIFEEVEADALEHAEHIGESGGNIKHQREHFEMLSNDIYDLAKAFGGGQDLYKDFCPMYNNGKGAYWLSETKDIQNPYYGREMLTCGSIKEELH